MDYFFPDRQQAKNKELLQRITERAMNWHPGGNHVYRHYHIKVWTGEKPEEEVNALLGVYRELTGTDTRSFAAPGWMTNPHVLRCFQQKGLTYSSDTRNGRALFYPEMGGETFRVLQIPTTMPTLDEVVGGVGTDMPALIEYYQNAISDKLNILTVHAEIEGNRWTGFLEGFVGKAIENGFVFKRLIDIAEEYADNPEVPVCSVEYGFVNGRAGEVCLQGKGVA
jgi:peptidoglycan/xylan/chitin deacetylase (PgdA/CDA1 family)